MWSLELFLDQAALPAPVSAQLQAQLDDRLLGARRHHRRVLVAGVGAGALGGALVRGAQLCLVRGDHLLGRDLLKEVKLVGQQNGPPGQRAALPVGVSQ